VTAYDPLSLNKQTKKCVQLHFLAKWREQNTKGSKILSQGENACQMSAKKEKQLSEEKKNPFINSC
jgi:hypothetical protein